MSKIFVVRRDDDWAVRRPGASRVSSVHDTQADAIQEGQRMAKREGAELVIQGRDGRFRDSDSYGSDPFPPRDRKH